jgi:predicted DNA-binding transcriptional regulator YafY
MNRIDRLFGILTLLQSKKYVPAEKIAERFGISVRTVYRDIKALGEQGIPVSFEQHRGYFIVQGYFLPPVSFSSEEANALLLVQSMVSGFTDQSIHKHYSSALNKIKSVLKSSQKESLEFLDNNIRMQLPPCFVNNFEYLSLLQNAISQKRVIEMDYKNKNEVVSKRDVEPIGLVFYAFSWHLVGWCHLRQEYRDFKLVRILKVRDKNLAFTKSNHIDLNEYIKAIPAGY